MVNLLSEYGNHIKAGSTNSNRMNRKCKRANSSDDQAREFTRIGSALITSINQHMVMGRVPHNLDLLTMCIEDQC